MIPFYEISANRPLAQRIDGLNYPVHLHSELELLYVERGRLHVTVNERSHLLERGQLAVIFPNSVHSYHTDPAPGNRFYMIIAGTDICGDYQHMLRQYHPSDPFLPQPLPADLTYAFRRLVRQKADGCTPAVFKAYLQLLLALIQPMLQLLPNTDGDFYGLPFRAISYIQRHYLQPLSLEAVSRAVGVSRYSLSRLFSGGLHTSFCDYVNGLRVQRAQQLLDSTDLPVTQIAFDSGFDNPRTFNRAFLHVCGVTPREFRNAVRKVSPSAPQSGASDSAG